MKQKNIGIKDIGNYYHMDPLNRLWKVALPGYTCVVAMNYYEDDPKGIILYSTFGEDITIEWLFVEEDFRESGVGEFLLNGVFEQALLQDRRFVCADITGDKRESRLFPHREAYFGLHYFEDEIEVAGEWRISLKKLSALFPSTDDPVKTLPLDLYDKKKFESVLSAFEESTNSEMLYPIWEKPELLDQSVSVVYSEMGRVTGTLFMIKVKDKLYVAGYFVKDKKCFEDMIKEMAASALEIYPEDTVVVFRATDEQNSGFLSELSGNRTTKYQIRVAEVNRFFEAQVYGPDADYQILENFMPF